MNGSKYVFYGKRKDNNEIIEGDLINNYDGRKFIGEVVVDDYIGNGDDKYDVGISFEEVIPETIELRVKELNMNSNFQIGNKVMVFQNSERIPPRSYIGKTGVVIGSKSKDVIVRFDDNKVGYIYDKDIKII